MIVRFRFRLTLAAALAAHAWLAWELRPRPTPEIASSNARPLEADIEIEAPPLEAPAAPVEPATAASIERAPAAHDRAGGSRSPTPATQAAPAESPSAAASVVTAPPDAPSDGSWTFSPTRAATGGRQVPAGLARGGEVGVREAMIADEKKAAAQAPPPLFTTHDFALGLVPGGRFVGMTRDDVRTSLVPDISRALLEFDTNREGIVVTVRVLDVSSDRVSWDDVAAALRVEASTGRPERVPPGVSGLAIVLEVISTLKTANGTAPTHGAFESAMRAINNPVDVALEGKKSPHREVSARVVDVHAL